MIGCRFVRHSVDAKCLGADEGSQFVRPKENWPKKSTEAFLSARSAAAKEGDSGLGDEIVGQGSKTKS